MIAAWISRQIRKELRDTNPRRQPSTDVLSAALRQINHSLSTLAGAACPIVPRDDDAAGIGEVRLTAWTFVRLDSQCFQKRQVVS